MEALSSNVTAAALMQFVQPEVQKYLEAVYAVQPVPGEYVRYRLHLATALPLDLLDAWFELRRKTSFYQDLNANASGNGTGLAPSNGAGKPKFSLFGSFSDDHKQQANQDESEGGERTEHHRPASTLQNSSDLSGSRPPPTGIPDDSPSVPSKTESGNLDGDALAPSRFMEADLEVISSLIGLETLTSTQKHCGSSSLFLFEQLTALDSLDMESKPGSKRRRTRHQHFWRNTDKLDANERVYIPTSCIRPALNKNEPIVPKTEIRPDERTNAWTVCLTTQGVVSYLNKHISPLGVQVIRALQKKTKEVDKPPIWPRARSLSQTLDTSTQAEESSPKRSASDALNRALPLRGSELQANTQQGLPRTSEPDLPEHAAPRLVVPGQEGRSGFKPVQAAQAPEIIPRARRRKPNN